MSHCLCSYCAKEDEMNAANHARIARLEGALKRVEAERRDGGLCRWCREATPDHGVRCPTVIARAALAGGSDV